MKGMSFSFSDTIGGYVTSVDQDKGSFGLKTSDGREFQVTLTPTVFAELLHNLNDPYADCTAQMRDMLAPDRFLYAHGVFYPQKDGHAFEAKHVVFVGRTPGEYLFEKPDWWVKQVRALGNWWLRAQFGQGEVNWRNYRTKVSDVGKKLDDFRQETDTISRLIYGFATAYLMTGDDRFLDAAESGTEYLREHMRFVDTGEGIAFWYHGIDVKGRHERKILASEFGDDYDAIPAYEQIYALAGPIQTYRATGDPQILRDAEMTLNLFERHLKDTERGGYFSHLDPITLDPRSQALGENRAKKNWNSVGDHAPAYLINLWLATGEQRYADMLRYTADMIEAHFPDYEHSPFVQERFLEDWSHDTTWGWQQNRAVVGHNLKIAWNLMRIAQLAPNDRYIALARKIAEIMPTAGMDRQRGGWYDVMERLLGEGEETHRFVWHDRKAWWQQEQGILAYLILAGVFKDEEYLRLARESAAFYNTWFLDHDDGAVFFNVLASGLPYMMGTERLKGSHSMSGYHTTELCYLGAVYTNLLINKQPMEFFFRPKPRGFKDNVLRVQPDILPPGTVRIGEVWIDGARHTDFDPYAMTVQLPNTDRDLHVKVRLIPAQVFTTLLDVTETGTILTLSGVLDESTLPALEAELERAVAQQPKRLVLAMHELESVIEPAIRALVLARHRMDVDLDIIVVGARDRIREALAGADFAEECTFSEEYDPATVAKRGNRHNKRTATGVP